MASSSWRHRTSTAFVALTFPPMLAAAVVAACGDDAKGKSGQGELDGSIPPSLPETGVIDEDAEAPAATMRLAHLARGIGSLDFCYQAAGTGTFEGPVLSRASRSPRVPDAAAPADAGPADASLVDADAGDGATPPGGLELHQVSRYLVLDAAGPLTIALVEAGSTTCANPMLVANVTLDPGKLVTVALMGSPDADGGAGSLALVPFVDDRETMQDKARVRAIHAATGVGTIALRAVAPKPVPIADEIEPRHVAASTMNAAVDALGYASLDPLPAAALAVVPTETSDAEAGATGWLSEPADLGLEGGSIHTAFVLVGEGRPFEVVWCADTVTAGDVTSCVVLR